MLKLKLGTSLTTGVRNFVPEEPPTIFDFLNSSFSPLTFVGPGNMATYRDSNYKLQRAVANTPRISYNSSGVKFGTHMEPTRINLFPYRNATPVATTGFSAAGTGTIALVSDTAAIAADGLENVVTGNVFEFSTGASPDTFTIPGQVGQTANPVSFTMDARIVTGTSAQLKSSAGSNNTQFSNTAYSRVKLENQTMVANTDTMQLYLPANTTVRAILFQTEVGKGATSRIICEGAATTRAMETLTDTALASRPFFDAAEGTMFMEYIPADIVNHENAHSIIMSNDTGVTNCRSAYMVAGRAKIRTRDSVGGVAGLSSDFSSVGSAFKRTYSGLMWINGTEETVIAGPLDYETFVPAGPLNSLARLNIGSRPFTESLNGWVRTVWAWKKKKSFLTLGSLAIKTGDKIVTTSGQSNIANIFRQQQTGNNTGEQAGQALLDSSISNDGVNSRNWLAPTATGGTSVGYISGGDPDGPWWVNLDPATIPSVGQIGGAFKRWINMVQGYGNAQIIANIDQSCESDVGAWTQQQFYDLMLFKFQKMWATAGYEFPIFIGRMHRRSDYQEHSFDLYEAAKRQLTEDYPTKFYLLPDIYDQGLGDEVHLDDTGHQVQMTRYTRKILKTLGYSISGNVDGPEMVSANYQGTDVLVNIQHEGSATDFTPTTNIAGFHVTTDVSGSEVEIPITAADRVTGSQVRLTLSSAITGGTIRVYSHYGTMLPELTTYANTLHDNSAQQLPLRSRRIVATARSVLDLTTEDGISLTAEDGTTLTNEG